MLRNIIPTLCTQPTWLKCIIIIICICIMLVITFYGVHKWKRIYKVIGCILAFPIIYICFPISFHTTISIFCNTDAVLNLYDDTTSFWVYLYDMAKNSLHQMKTIWNSAG